ncbi:MAG: hypothetical protein RIQ60_2639 [Pseudomonadota bacterium]|jgi:CRISPR-associated protein Csd1
MILQALHSYYERRQRLPDPADRLPMPGLEDKEIPFVLEVAPDGRLVAISDTRQIEGKKKIAKRFLVPQGVKKTSGVAANLLWDTAEYVLGLDTKGKSERVAEQTAAFRARVDALLRDAPDEPGLLAVQRFLAADPLHAARAQPLWPEIEAGNPVLSLRLRDDVDLICQRPAVLGAITGQAGSDEDGPAFPCLITGRDQPPERLHSAIKGVWGAQTSGANIVSFNLDAFRSYGKEQGANAPVSPGAAFAYTTALNSLLAKGSRQRMQVGDASTVFWSQAQEDADVENGFAALFGDPVDDPNAHTDQVRALYEAVRSGHFDGAAGERHFYVLGLAPNAARIAIRFWHAKTLGELSTRIRAWFGDIEIAHSANEPEFLNVKRLLTSACLATSDRPHGDIQRLPPAIGGDLIRCILDGTEIPSLLVNAVIERCRAEQAKKDDKTGKPVRHVSYPRAALMRVFVNRYRRIHQPEKREIAVSLDKDFPDPAYALGRLFAVFERMQEVAAGRDLNKTIRDAYFGAAMSTPRAVFSRLNRLNQIHLRDIKRGSPGNAIFFERLTLEINNKINPREMYLAVFPLREQSLFALGYYHQRQAFFTKSDADEPAASAPAAEAATADIPTQASLK